MKKLIFLFSFVFVASMVNAQACKKNKKCCAKKAKTSTTMTEVGNATSEVSFDYAAADKVAEMDDSVEKRVCDKSGTVSYYKKSVCSVSGKESFSEVEFCTKSNAFKEVAVSDMKEESAKETDEGM